MKEFLILLTSLFTAGAKLLGRGGAKALIAENLLLKQQLLISCRHRRRAPNLAPKDRFFLGFWSLFLQPRRLTRNAIAVQPSTLLRFHQYLVRRKYRALFTPKKRGKPGPKELSDELIQAIVELKRRNPRFGCPRIALIISRTFGIDIDKNVVRRVLAEHYLPISGGNGPSWLTFLGHMKDSLWSVDLFRCQSINLKSHWVMIVMDQYTRRIIGFGVHAGAVDGNSLCRMFNRILGSATPPRYLSSDNDPLFTYHRWLANLRILETTGVKTVPCAPVSHPFIERLVGTVRREFLDHALFWTAIDLERKLAEFQGYYNAERVHSSLGGATPAELGGESSSRQAKLSGFEWKRIAGEWWSCRSRHDRRIRDSQVPRLRRILIMLDTAEQIAELRLFPGWRLHRLKGELQGYWSISVSGNWRVIFRFEEGDALDVDLVDYH